MVDLFPVSLSPALLARVADVSTAVAAETREARARVKGVRDHVAELETELENRRREPDAIDAENEREADTPPDIRRVNVEARRELVEAPAANRARSFIQSDRRSGDRERIRGDPEPPRQRDRPGQSGGNGMAARSGASHLGGKRRGRGGTRSTAFVDEARLVVKSVEPDAPSSSPRAEIRGSRTPRR